MNRSSSHEHIKELARVPLTDFWNRWRRRLLPPSNGFSKPPNLRDAEKQRDDAKRQASEELATIMTTTSTGASADAHPADRDEPR